MAKMMITGTSHTTPGMIDKAETLVRQAARRGMRIVASDTADTINRAVIGQCYALDVACTLFTEGDHIRANLPFGSENITSTPGDECQMQMLDLLDPDDMVMIFWDETSPDGLEMYEIASERGLQTYIYGANGTALHI